MVRKEWLKKSISELADIQSGGTPSTSNEEFWNGDIRWCTPSDITKNNNIYLQDTERRITEKGVENSSAILLPIGTILLCTRATIGEMAIANIPMCTNQGFKNLIPHKGVDSLFLYYILHTVKKEMIAKAYGSTFLELSKKSLESICIMMPDDEEEQRRISTALYSIDQLINNIEKEIEKKKNIKIGIMQEYLTGKKRINGFSEKWEEKPLRDLCILITKQTGFDYSAEIKPSLVSDHYNNTIPFLQNKDFEGYKINYETDFYIPTEVAYKYPKIFLEWINFLLILQSIQTLGMD